MSEQSTPWGCEEAREHLAAELEAALERPGLAAHLAACPACARWWAGLGAALGELRQPVAAPAVVAARVREAGSAPRRRFAPAWRWLPVGLAAGVAVMLLVPRGQPVPLAVTSAAGLGNYLTSQALLATHEPLGAGPAELAVAVLAAREADE